MVRFQVSDGGVVTPDGFGPGSQLGDLMLRGKATCEHFEDEEPFVRCSLAGSRYQYDVMDGYQIPSQDGEVTRAAMIKWAKGKGANEEVFRVSFGEAIDCGGP